MKQNGTTLETTGASKSGGNTQTATEQPRAHQVSLMALSKKRGLVELTMLKEKQANQCGIASTCWNDKVIKEENRSTLPLTYALRGGLQSKQ